MTKFKDLLENSRLKKLEKILKKMDKLKSLMIVNFGLI